LPSPSNCDKYSRTLPRLLKYSTILIALTALLSTQARSQQAPAPLAQSTSAATYADTPEGLQQFFANFLAAAKISDHDKMAALIQATRIPDFANWFVETYGAEPGQAWADSHRANLEKNEAVFAELCAQLAQKSGTAVAREIHDIPEQPVNTYLVTWKSEGGGAGTSQNIPIAYFIFAGGTFRLDNALVFRNLQSQAGLIAPDANASTEMPPQTPDPKAYSPAPVSVTGTPDGPFVPGVGGVGFPTCIYCPQPYFSDEARTGNLQGVELLTLTVQPDGHVTHLSILKSMGEEPDELAIATVHGWRLEPAFGPDGQPVAVTSQLQITFQLTPRK
jgi:TonB family protein